MKLKTYQIDFKNIVFFLPFGHLSEERKLGQRIYIDVTIKLDANQYKNLSNIHTIYDYTQIEKTLNDLIHKRDYFLLEELSETLAMDLIQKDMTIVSVIITIRKPSVPINLVLDYASSTMEFTR